MTPSTTNPPPYVPPHGLLSGRSVLITAAAGGGIGFATARRVLEEGAFRRLGGKAEVLMLPSVGLRGNTHIPFADLNNAQVAEQLFLFLRKHGLDR